MKFTEHMKQLIADRAEGRASREIFRYNTKMAARRLAEELGVPVAELVIPPATLADLGGLAPRRSVVLKPIHGCSGRGVLPLAYNPHLDLYWSLWHDVRMPRDQTVASTWAYWVTQLAGMKARLLGTESEIMGPWIGEELLRGPQGQPLATVWKVYCIHGCPVWSRQIVSEARRGGAVECWRLVHDERAIGVRFERVGHDVFTNHKLQRYDALPRPTTPHLYGFAQRIAEAVQARTGSPFVRVDLLEGPEGRVVFGEITPHPSGGNDDYLPEWDEELGRIWSEGLE